MYLSVIIRHTLIPNLSRSKNFVLRSFRSLSINGIWAFWIPTDTTFEVVTSAIETQKSSTNIPDIPPEDDSDDPYDIQDNDF
jgi:hypothetical protein